MLKSIFKFLLYFLVIALITSLVFAFFIMTEDPDAIQKSLITLAWIFGGIMLFIIVRKLFIRLKARSQVRRLIQEEKPSDDAEDLGMSSSQLIRELRRGWRSALINLKKSNLRLQGDAVYVLPWYMVIGKPRSGKSTALKNAKLLLPDIDLPKQGEGSTLNLDWWLYEEAIVLDTAGRYAVPDESQRDKKEWATLLGMLSRHKQKEPINGLVLVVAADRLLNNTEEQLMEEGRQVRASINELMERLEVKVPVYLMVTKCDLIEGFDTWSEYLPQESKLQAMGYLHEGAQLNLDELIDNVLNKILDRIKELRVLMLERSQSHSNELLVLPNRIEKIRSGLHTFVGTALKENPYQDTPSFRGLFLSSSQKSIGSEERLESRGLFLHEFFTRVLPADRGLLDSLPSALRLRRAVVSYAFSIAGGVTLLALATLSIFYTQDMLKLQSIVESHGSVYLTQKKIGAGDGKNEYVEKDISEKIAALYSLQELIAELQLAQDDWIIPWLGVSADNITDDLIARFIDVFKEGVLDELDAPMKNAMSIDELIIRGVANKQGASDGLDVSGSLNVIINESITSNTELLKDSVLDVLDKSLVSHNDVKYLIVQEADRFKNQVVKVLDDEISPTDLEVFISDKAKEFKDSVSSGLGNNVGDKYLVTKLIALNTNTFRKDVLNTLYSSTTQQDDPSDVVARNIVRLKKEILNSLDKPIGKQGTIKANISQYTSQFKKKLQVALTGTLADGYYIETVITQSAAIFKREVLLAFRDPIGQSDSIKEVVLTSSDVFRNKIMNELTNHLVQQKINLQRRRTSSLAGGLIRRINLLNAEINNKNGVEHVYLDDKPAVSSDYTITVSSDMTWDSGERFNELYLSYLNWNNVKVSLEGEKGYLQTAFFNLTNREGRDFSWIIDWANQQGQGEVTLDDFWGGTIKVKESPSIPFAYTLEGRTIIYNFLDELVESNQKQQIDGEIIEQADDEGEQMSQVGDDFKLFYSREYAKKWLQFAERFDEGKQRFRDRKEWLSGLEQLSTKENPYFKLIRRMATEMESVEVNDAYNGYDGKEQFEYFGAVQDHAGVATDAAKGDNKAATKMAIKAVSKLGKVGKVVAKVAKKGMKAKKKLGGKNKGGKDLDALIEDASKALLAYNKSLGDTVFNAASKTQSHSSIATVFTMPDNPGAGDGPMSDAYNAVRGMQRVVGNPKPSTKLFWSLYQGPMGLIYDYMEKETNCHLQQEWETQVLAQLDGLSENKLGATLIGPDTGLVWKYIDGVAAPFLQKRLNKGYLPTSVEDRKMLWSGDFIDFVNRAEAGSTLVGTEFDVGINTIPTGVNSDSAISPYSTILKLHCADGEQTLANYNYSDSHLFKWSLESCGDVSLQIDIGHISLRKEYSGPKGFSLFLQDFHDGHRVFEAKEFPQQEALLRKESAYAIDVNYEFFNHEPVLNILNSVPLNPPGKIAECWPGKTDGSNTLAAGVF